MQRSGRHDHERKVPSTIRFLAHATPARRNAGWRRYQTPYGFLPTTTLTLAGLSIIPPDSTAGVGIFAAINASTRDLAELVSLSLGFTPGPADNKNSSIISRCNPADWSEPLIRFAKASASGSPPYVTTSNVTPGYPATLPPNAFCWASVKCLGAANLASPTRSAVTPAPRDANLRHL